MRWTRKEICLPGAALFISACAIAAVGQNSSGHPTPGRKMPDPIQTTSGGDSLADQIVFLTLSIRHDPRQGSREIQIQGLVKTPGKLKKRTANPALSGPYLCALLYAGPELLDSIKLDHPLYQHQEYVTEKKQLRQLSHHRDHSEFFIRFQQGRATRMLLEERLPQTPAKPLLRIDL